MEFSEENFDEHSQHKKDDAYINDDDDESWVALNLSADQDHKLEPHFVNWEPPSSTKESAFADDFYDPTADDIDEQWMEDMLGKNYRQSDAVLSCAGCFTQLCYQCTRIRSKGTYLYETKPDTACRVIISLQPPSSSSSQKSRRRHYDEYRSKDVDSNHTYEIDDHDRCNNIPKKRIHRLSEHDVRRDMQENEGRLEAIPEEDEDTQDAIDEKKLSFDTQINKDNIEEPFIELLCSCCYTNVGYLDRRRNMYVFTDVLPGSI